MRFVAAVLVIGAGVWLGAATQAPIAQPVVRTSGSPDARFEEASVRPCDPDAASPAPDGARGGGPNTFQMTPGRVHIQCMTLATIIRVAYGYSPARNDPGNRGNRSLRLNNVYGLGTEDGLRVRGGPDWVRSDRFSIDAVAADASDPDTLRGPMLRTLLEERFKLQTHVDHDEVQVLAMTVAKSGVRLTPAAIESCEEPAPNPGPDARARTAAEVRAGQKPTCGIYQNTNGAMQMIVAGASTVDNLLVALITQLRTVVIDDTGLKDRFNFIVEYPADDPQAIVRAIEVQLGLIVAPANTPRVFLVVDRVERPTAN